MRAYLQVQNITQGARDSRLTSVVWESLGIAFRAMHLTCIGALKTRRLQGILIAFRHSHLWRRHNNINFEPCRQQSGLPPKGISLKNYKSKHCGSSSFLMHDCAVPQSS